MLDKQYPGFNCFLNEDPPELEKLEFQMPDKDYFEFDCYLNEDSAKEPKFHHQMSNEDDFRFGYFLNTDSPELEKPELPPMSLKSIELDDLDFDKVFEEIDQSANMPPQKSPLSPSPQLPSLRTCSPHLLDNPLDPISLRRKLDLECAAAAKLWDNSLSSQVWQDVMVVPNSNSDKGDNHQEQMDTSHPNMGPIHNSAPDAKQTIRKTRNSTSGNPSREKKEVEKTQLEAQVYELREENSSLLMRLKQIETFSDKEAGENRVLKAQVQELRAKVRLREVTLKNLLRSKLGRG